MKFFNTAGPVNQEEHYKINPNTRWDLDEILMLIAQKKYFVLHAPRQSGKTSTLLALQKYLNERDDYIVVYTNVEVGQAARNDINEAIRGILSVLVGRMILTVGHKKEIENIFEDIKRKGDYKSALNDFLKKISELLKKPLVLLIDEIDSLIGDTLISVLRQLRAGYDMRPENFPSSVVLCGLVDIKDYKIHRSDGEIITGGSAFNIKARAFTFNNFTIEEIKTLYLQHTDYTGQKFEEGVFELVYNYTGGQPWLVNALAYEVTFEMKENRDRSVLITKNMIKEAKERLILRRETHLDQLVDKLKEKRVYSVIKPMLLGEYATINPNDSEYCIDLGLIKKTKQGLVISNEIYKEVIPRELTNSTQESFLSRFTPDWVNKDETINVDKLMEMFVQFWRENADIWHAEIAGYQEAAAHLVFMGFLQRVANGNGSIDREYGLSRKRADLFLEWSHPKGVQRIVFELKLRTNRQNTDKALQKIKDEGITQTLEYADICGSEENHLIIFDRRDNIKWSEKIYKEKHEKDGKVVVIWGM